MKINKPDIPKKYRPSGFEILHEDLDLIVVDKEAGILSVAALWNDHDTVLNRLNIYIKKGNTRSKKVVHVVHRLDQATSGILVFAKSETALQHLKKNWADNVKIYYAIVQGQIKKKIGLIESFLQEDENYQVHSSQDKNKGKLARTEYEVISENKHCSLVKINLLTGKKNQIRVHLSELGHPIVDDIKYGAKGKAKKPGHPIMLHAYSLELTHPFTQNRVTFVSEIPIRFKKFLNLAF
jgi:RluA family pseudouridine synthase